MEAALAEFDSHTGDQAACESVAQPDLGVRNEVEQARQDNDAEYERAEVEHECKRVWQRADQAQEVPSKYDVAQRLKPKTGARRPTSASTGQPF